MQVAGRWGDGEQGSRGAGEQGSRGDKGTRRQGEFLPFTFLPFCLLPSASCLPCSQNQGKMLVWG
ncbi:hypothetical protein NIES2119_06230 [[Phormidium ambiguum] IAM M-71]|uniref:Uncharacterized protein n=1 Tax=[Phormidium ambiguum] IAM M-71 TaxID=454136 RepID=A0A1U7IPS3_9CYAN|nr:hypothetical protein NIES2119_06230 [Phormidium ambiguum IAM M-71]